MSAKDTFFYRKFSLNCGGTLLDLSSPKIMGILNITSDSFFESSRYQTEETILENAARMLKEGAAILDVGGQSTRPGAEIHPENEESDKVLPAIELISKNFPEAIISVDTFRSSIARKAIKAGAHIINDVSGGTMDNKMFETVGELQVPYILMHILGTPETMQENPVYSNVTKEVFNYFLEKIEKLRSFGVKDIVLDPGFGFGKTLEHNYQLLQHFPEFRFFDMPILAGVSRKSMVNKIIKTKPENALNGTTVVNTIALLNGASILRVHDVKEAKQAIEIVQYYRSV